MSRFLKENSAAACEEFATEYVRYANDGLCLESFLINHNIGEKRFKELEKAMFDSAKSRQRAAMHGFGVNVRPPKKIRRLKLTADDMSFMAEHDVSINEFIGVDERRPIAL